MRARPLHDLVSGLQFRLVLGFALALAVALAAVGILISLVTEWQTERFETDRDLARGGRVSQFITNNYVEERAEDGLGAGLQSLVEQASGISGLRITMFDAHGTVVADSSAPSPAVPISNPDLVDGSGWGDEPDLAGWDIEAGQEGEVFPLVYDGKPVGSLVASSDFGPAPEVHEFGLADPDASRISGLVNRYLLWAGIGAAALGIMLVWALSRRTLSPLQSLGATARRLGRGDLSQRAEVTGPTEIRHLAHSFNSMAADLEEAENRRQSLTADIAHELRAPTSNIQGYLEAIKDGVFQPTPKTIDTIHEQALLLSRLVEDLRLLAQVDAGELRLDLTQTRVEELVQSCVDALRHRAKAKGVSLGVDVDVTLPELYLDPARIAQAIGNLLDNAVTHTPEYGRVTVSARVWADGVEVAVADTGPGIAPEDLRRVFDRFYRADPSRSRSTGGAGLGLTIARRLVEAHGGSIEAASVVGQGSRFFIRLPGGRR